MCGINVCLVQLQDMHDMQENACQSNLQLIFLQTIYLVHATETGDKRRPDGPFGS